MNGISKFIKPVVNIPLEYTSDTERDAELSRLLLLKGSKDLEKIKSQSIKKSLLFKLLSDNNVNSAILKDLTLNPELILGYGNLTEYQNKFGDLEYNLMTSLKGENLLTSAKGENCVADSKKGMFKNDALDSEKDDGWGMETDLELDLNDDYTTSSKDDDSEHEIQTIDAEEQESAENNDLFQLKRRLFSTKYTENAAISSDKENEIEEKNHEEMLEELAKLTKALKNNTLQFHNQLETADKETIDKTEANLMSSGKKLQVLGTKLGKFSRSKLGVFFYLAAIASMLLGLFLTYLIIKIFPEM